MKPNATLVCQKDQIGAKQTSWLGHRQSRQQIRSSRPKARLPGCHTSLITQPRVRQLEPRPQRSRTCETWTSLNLCPSLALRQGKNSDPECRAKSIHRPANPIPESTVRRQGTGAAFIASEIAAGVGSVESQTRNASPECCSVVTLVASAVPTICSSPIANSPGLLLASRVKADLRGW